MKKNILVAIIIIVLAVAGGLYYWFYQAKTPIGSQTAAAGVANSQTANQLQAVLAKLGTHLVLPTNEVPQVGQIDDPAQAVKSQPFVAGAQKGDLVIVYVKARKAIVYSPSRDLIINVGPVSVDSSSANITPTTTQAKAPVKKK